jgi:nitrate reductase (NAD(P)H)
VVDGSCSPHKPDNHNIKMSSDFSDNPKEVDLPVRLPLTPPHTDESASGTSEDLDILDVPLPPKSNPPTQVLDVDKDTPDNHVPRDPRLIRLTGIHPFNVEAPLTDLFNEGM